MIQPLDVPRALADLSGKIADAMRNYDNWIISDDEHWNPAWEIEICFLQILAIVEAVDLNELHKMILSDYVRFKESKEGFSKSEKGPDEPYSVCLSRLRQYLHAIRSFLPQENQTKVTRDLLQIISDIHYIITDKALFGSAPASERDVHIRVEGILKCVYPDLKHKPVLTKSIKNFEPDTGIPSIGTLIEYKFLSHLKGIPTIADQLLADTRGYVSKDWNRFLYVLYETNRFKPEKEWRQLLLQSGVPENTAIVVLSGEPLPNKKIKRKS